MSIAAPSSLGLLLTYWFQQFVWPFRHGAPGVALRVVVWGLKVLKISLPCLVSDDTFGVVITLPNCRAIETLGLGWWCT